MTFIMQFKNYEILNSRQIKEITKRIKNNWGCKFDKKNEFIYLMNRKNKIHLLNRAAGEIEISRLGIDYLVLTYHL